DAREAAYGRIDVSAQLGSRAVTYAVPEPVEIGRGTILRSYLDTVLSGFFAVYGPEGLAHFRETTDGWEARIEDDRDAPRYPRSRVPGPDAAAAIAAFHAP
ncbi:MAG: gamma-glutamylcyclotransferase, partial [Shimia sp.]